MRVEIYSDIACPWCYIGKRRFEAALAAFSGAGEIEVVYRAFQLNADFPSEPAAAIAHDTYMRERFGPGFEQKVSSVVALAAREGLDMRFDQALVANTLLAHRLAGYAEREGGLALKTRMIEALFRAQFTEGVNVADPDALVKVAASLGLDEVSVREYMASSAGTDQVQRELEQGRELGITGVPTFIFEGQWGVSGAHEAARLIEVMETVARETAGRPAIGNGDGGEDDACRVS